jgi:hypothetical protein
MQIAAFSATAASPSPCDGESGAPGEIRTPDPLVRSQVLYPTELRAHRTYINADILSANR